jgi:hypothetical protein
MIEATATRTPPTERESLIAELIRIRFRLILVTGNGQENFAAVCALLTRFNVSVTPRIPLAVRACFPEVEWGDVAHPDGAWATVTEVLPDLLDRLLADGVL